MYLTILITVPAGSYKLGLFSRRSEAERFARIMLPTGSSWTIIED